MRTLTPDTHILTTSTLDEYIDVIGNKVGILTLINPIDLTAALKGVRDIIVKYLKFFNDMNQTIKQPVTHNNTPIISLTIPLT